MDGKAIEQALTAALWAVGLFFSASILRALRRYQRFWRARREALTTWPTARPHGRLLGLTIGMASAALAMAGFATQAGLQTFSQGMTALYFLGAVPLLASTRSGLYASGIWSPPDFLPYCDIARWAVPDSGRPTLIVVRRGHGSPVHLEIPTSELGTVIKVLEQKAREHQLRPEPHILNLSEQ